MKTQHLVLAAAAIATVLAFGSESFAAGRGAGGAGGSQIRSQTTTPSSTQVRPAGSQRRDGTFLTSGTTASGSAVRPSNGRGVMDGSGVNQVTTTP